jgi:site-specific DNA recombinase
MTRAAIYVRVSVDRDGDETSTARQEKACRAFCDMKGWDVGTVFRDRGVSAFRGKDRPGWAGLEKAVRAGEVEAVVVFAISRAARNTVRLLKFKELCDEHGVQFESTSEPIGGQYGDVFLAILGALAQLESKSKSDRLLLKHQAKAASGEWQGGRRPFGYVAVDGHLNIIDVEADAIREAATSLLNGGSLVSVTRRWNSLRLATTAGRPWTSRGVRAVMLSPRIAGLRAHNGDTVTAKWAPVVTRRDFSRLERLLTDPSRNTGGDYRARYLLTGILECGLCGGRMKGRPSKGTQQYVCTVTGTLHLAVKARDLGDYVMTLAETMTVGNGVVATDPTELSAPILAERDRIDEKLRDLGRRYADGSVADAAFFAAPSALAERLTEIEAELEAIVPQRPVDVYLATFDRFDVSTDPDVNARAWLESLVERVVLNPAPVRGRNAFDSSRVDIVWRPGVRESVAESA